VPLTLDQWSGVAVITSDSPFAPLAAEVDEYNPSGYLQSYNGLGWASPTAYLPYVTNSGGWITAIQVQNAGGSSNNAAVKANGTQIWSGSLAVNGWANVPVNATGQVVAQSTNGQSLVTEVDIYKTGGSDQLMSYTGDNR
jgi:hypothetical protein